MSGRPLLERGHSRFQKSGRSQLGAPTMLGSRGLAKAHFWANVILCSAFALASASYLASASALTRFHAILSEVPGHL